MRPLFELIAFGVWLLGVGWLVRAESAGFGTLAIVAGIGSLLSAARTGITGRSVGDLPTRRRLAMASST